MAVKIGGCTHVIAASLASADGFVMLKRFASTKLGVEVAGWYVPALMNLAAAICVYPLLMKKYFLECNTNRVRR